MLLLQTIRGVEATVEVTSLIEYIRLSAGTRDDVCPTMQHPTVSKAV